MVNKKLIVIRVIGFCVALLIMALIFSMSAQDATESSQTSGGMIAAIVKLFNKDFLKMSLEEQEEYIGGFQFFVRKIAHFGIYFLLGSALSLSAQTYVKVGAIKRTAVAAAIGVLYAVTDEIHQLFVDGRSCELRDVFIDSTGVFLGCICIVWLWVIVRKISKKNKAVV